MTDEQIKAEAKSQYISGSIMNEKAFIKGAKWYRDQMKDVISIKELEEWIESNKNRYSIINMLSNAFKQFINSKKQQP